MMNPDDTLLFASFVRLWYAVPLVVAISLVYGATRHEATLPILGHAWRFAAWLVGFMAVLFAILWVLTRTL